MMLVFKKRIEDIMDVSTLNATLLLIAGLCCLGTGIAAFRRYSITQSERLFIVGVSMTMAAIGITSGALDTIPALNHYGLEWAWYVGTSFGYFLLFLSSIMKSAEQFRILRRWSIITGGVVILMIILSPILPDISHNQNAIVLLNTLRAAICALGFSRYLALYTSKETRFSLLLCLAFLSLMIGYVTVIAQALSPVIARFLLIDIIIRIIGNFLLFIAFIAG